MDFCILGFMIYGIYCWELEEFQDFEFYAGVDFVGLFAEGSEGRFRNA